MSWIQNYQLFLFDFDGLLVNTEELHYLAYKQMMLKRGFTLNWSFERYCQSAHYSSEKFRKEIFLEYPELAKQDPTWEELYKEKQAIMMDLLKSDVHLMPGVKSLLEKIQAAQLNHVVVTHSPSPLINLVKQQHPILEKIPHWITRHDYTHPKPHSECYQIAIERFCKSGNKVVGFEDSPRGITALLGTEARPVLITKADYPEIESFTKQGVRLFSSFDELLVTDFD